MLEKKFTYEKTQLGDVEKLAISGYLDAQTATSLENAIEDIVKQGKFKILINFRELEYISSAGLGVFMCFIEQVRNNKGDIKMSALQPIVYNVFDLLGFPLLFDIMESDAEAIDRFNKGFVPNHVD
ncbi:MAG: anti-anti-sigma factor [Bacteroidetes bacterium 4572_77]|nr:MAG: anti-anti-sigma factor [Bacteroidetes bacterium 4572_77]